MSQVPNSPSRILITAERRQLYQLICDLQEDFSLGQVLEVSKKMGIKLSRTGILSFILTLCYHKHLASYKLKASNSRGRAKIYYKRLESLYTLKPLSD